MITYDDDFVTAFANYARSVLSYDSETGALRWKKRIGKGRPGEIAGTIRRNGYRCIGLINATWMSGRLAYLIQTGTFPPNDVDHRNGDKLDDKWSNLRPATRSQNVINTKRRPSRSGFRGVWANKNKYEARITVNNKRFYLGTFDTPEQAYACYCAASRKLHSIWRRTTEQPNTIDPLRLRPRLRKRLIPSPELERA